MERKEPLNRTFNGNPFPLCIELIPFAPHVAPVLIRE
jgi:hypothetical protein